MNIKSAFAGLAATICATAAFAAPASAATTNTTISPDYKGVFYNQTPRGLINGTGEVFRYNTSDWGEQVRVNAPAGKYTVFVIVGRDTDKDGQPDTFQAYNVCTFNAPDSSTLSGCGAQVPGLHANLLTKWSSVELFSPRAHSSVAYADLTRIDK